MSLEPARRNDNDFIENCIVHYYSKIYDKKKKKKKKKKRKNPSSKPTLTLTSQLGKYVGLGEG